MRFSRALVPTSKSAPSELASPGLALLHRGGFARRPGSASMAWLPLGQRVLANLVDIARRELTATGAHELGFGAARGDFASGAAGILRGCGLGARSLPIGAFEISGPRQVAHMIGFDGSAAWAEATRARLEAVLSSIAGAAGLPSAIAKAASPDDALDAALLWTPAGSCHRIELALDPASGYAATAEVADRKREAIPKAGELAPLESVITPQARTVTQVAELLDVPTASIIKTIVVIADGAPTLVCIRGDRTVSMALLRRALGAKQVEMAAPDAVDDATGCEPGFVGPAGSSLRTIADIDLEDVSDLVCGANEPDTHLRGVDLKRDANVESWANLSNAMSGDRARVSGKPFEWVSATALGNVTSAGTRVALDAEFATLASASGGKLHPFATLAEIDLTAVLLSVAEHWANPTGIAWPASIAPFEVSISVLKMTDRSCAEAGEELYRTLSESGTSALLDDRATSAGSKLSDAELIGAPVRVAIGPRSIAAGEVEINHREADNPLAVKVASAAETIDSRLAKIRREERSAWT